MIPENLVSYLKEKYKPDAIVLHGSRVRKDNFEDSDYDLLLIGNFDNPVVPHFFQGYSLDIAGITPQEKTYLSAKVPVWPLEIIYDSDKKYGETLYSNNLELYKKGPIKLTIQNIEDRKNYFRRLFAKLVNRYDNVQCRMHYAAEIHIRAIRYYFELSHQWDQSLPIALKNIQKENPLLYSELGNIFSGNTAQACATVFQMLFNEKI